MSLSKFFKKSNPAKKNGKVISTKDISGPSNLRIIGGTDGLSPSVRLIRNAQYGNIITSKYDIVRFYQDDLEVCYNAALAMYMCSTRSGGTYTEMAYHDEGRGPDAMYERKKADLENLYKNQPIIRPFSYTKKRDDWVKLYGSDMQFINARENKLTIKTCMYNSDMYPNPSDSQAYIKYIQTFERILSYGPVIACSSVTKALLPHYFTNGLSEIHGRHAYLVYGIVKYISNGELLAAFVCIDPNYPDHDTFIPVLAFIEAPWATITSNDTIQMRLNKEEIPIRIQDLVTVNTPITTGTLDRKQYKFYRYMNGPNPRIVGSMLRHGYDNRPQS